MTNDYVEHIKGAADVVSDHVLERGNDCNRNPSAPQEIRLTILNPPESRSSWDQRAIDAWYIGPECEHCHVKACYLPSTRGTRMSADYQLYPEHCEMPRETPMAEAVRVSGDLRRAIQQIKGEEGNNPRRYT